MCLIQTVAVKGYKSSVGMDKRDRKEMEAMLLHFRFMLDRNENWYLGRYYSRYMIKKTIHELEGALKSTGGRTDH